MEFPGNYRRFQVDECASESRGATVGRNSNFSTKPFNSLFVGFQAEQSDSLFTCSPVFSQMPNKSDASTQRLDISVNSRKY